MSRSNLGWLMGIVALSLLAFGVYLDDVSARDKDPDYEHIRLFVDVLHEVRSRYVDKLDRDRERKLVEDMLTGGLEKLNQHSAFVPPREYRQFTKRSKGKFGGIGIHVGYDKGKIYVITPMVGTPAFEAGVEADDIILEIDGKKTDSMSMNEAIDLIQGDEGEKITLKVKHEDGKVETLDMKRKEIEVPTVLGDLRKADDLTKWNFVYDKEARIGYIRLTEFTETSAREMKDALTELKSADVKGIVLDLRGNPGGLLRSARDICSLFVSEGKVVTTKGRDDEEETLMADPRETIFGEDSGVAVAVLVNRNSASASEIVSACLQDHKRAVVVGERSYGKGSVQNVIPMEKGRSALKLTTARYYPPSGRNIDRRADSKESDDWGVRPDKGMTVELTKEQRSAYAKWRNERDIVRTTKQSAKKETKPFVDEVMKKAVDHLKEQIKKVERETPLHERARG